MRFGYLRGYIVTATDAGSIDLNAKIVCKADEVNDALLQRLLWQANEEYEQQKETEEPNHD